LKTLPSPPDSASKPSNQPPNSRAASIKRHRTRQDGVSAIITTTRYFPASSRKETLPSSCPDAICAKPPHHLITDDILKHAESIPRPRASPLVAADSVLRRVPYSGPGPSAQ
jgi:hypothetical protein